MAGARCDRRVVAFVRQVAAETAHAPTRVDVAGRSMHQDAGLRGKIPVLVFGEINATGERELGLGKPAFGPAQARAQTRVVVGRERRAVAGKILPGVGIDKLP